MYNFSQIKGPLKRLARTIQAHIRYYWNAFLRAENQSRSWLDSHILPIWTFSVAALHFIKMLCKKSPCDAPINETTPLLEEEDTPNVKPSTRRNWYWQARIIRDGVPVKPLEMNLSLVDRDSPCHDPPTVYFSVDPYCVICRRTFHENEKDLPPDSQSKWDRQFIAICPVVIRSRQRYFAVKLEKTEEDEVILRPLGLEKNTPVLINVHVARDSLKKEGMQPIHVPMHHLRRDAYAVHRHCRSLAASVFPDDHIQKLIAQFGRSTRFIGRIWCCEDTWRGTLQHMSPYLSSLDKANDVVKLLSMLSAFPPELEDEIMNYAEHNLLSNVINFHRSTVPLIRSMSEFDNQIQYLLFKDSKCISAETIPIYQSAYFSSLALHAEVSPADSSSLKVEFRDISGIQIGLGDYGGGVQALRFLYKNTTSACIGMASESSFITQIGTNITGLKIVKDNFKIIAIELIAERTWHLPTPSLTPTGFPTHPTLKSHMLPHSITTSVHSFPGWRLKSQESLTKRNFNTWHMSSYHSLPSCRTSVESITLYCLKDSVCGIAFESRLDNSVDLLGSRNPLACAIHLEFCHNERLGHILADIDASGTNRCSPLILTTNLSRILTCSPVFQSQTPVQTTKHIQLRNPQNEIISGIFTDGTTHPDGSIRNLGVTFGEEPLEEKPIVEEENPEPPRPIPKVPHLEDLHVPTSNLPDAWTTAFISTAKFDNVKEVATCKRGNRITGLRIRHFDDKPSEILGQFDPSNRSSIKTIYKSEAHGKILTVIFRYASKTKIGWGDADCEYVCAVEVIAYNTPLDLSSSLPSGAKDGRKFVISGDELLKPIAWLFNPTNDHIQTWDGKTQKIEFIESSPQKELLLNPGVELPEHQSDPDFVLWDEHEAEDSDDEDASDEMPAFQRRNQNSGPRGGIRVSRLVPLPYNR